MNNFDYGRQFLPTIKNILGPIVFEEAPPEMDMREATDLVVLKARDMRVGCRVRRPHYWDKYGWQFTIRSQSYSGLPTELDKIIQGWGDWLFFGFQHSERSISILRWYVIDLHHFRAHLIQGTDCCPGIDIPNGDGTCFAAWDIRNFADTPPLCVKTFEPCPAPTILPGCQSSFSSIMKTWAAGGV